MDLWKSASSVMEDKAAKYSRQQVLVTGCGQPRWEESTGNLDEVFQ